MISTVDIKCRGDQVAAGPLADLVIGSHCGHDIHFCVLQSHYYSSTGAPCGSRDTIWCSTSRSRHGADLLFRFLNLFHVAGAQFFDLIEKHPVAGLVVDVMDIDVTDDAVVIDDEDGSLSVPFAPEDAVFHCHFPMRPEIAEDGIVDAAKCFRPCLQAGNVINADAQNLGI